MSALGWRNMSPDELEDAYSPSSCLPDRDYRRFVERYVSESRDAWELVNRHDRVETVAYGPLESNTIDVALPSAADRDIPLLVFVHGGYWQELSKAESRFAAADCVERGWAFAAIDYTLAPAIDLDGIVAEVREAVRLLVSSAGTLGIAADRVVVAGSSAGAHLAAMAALDPAAARPALGGIVLVSGIFELEPLVSTSINDALGLDVDAARRNSPAFADLTAIPTTLIAYGEHETDEFKAQSASFAERLGSHGVAHRSIEVPGRNHFDVILDLARPGTLLSEAVAELIA